MSRSVDCAKSFWTAVALVSYFLYSIHHQSYQLRDDNKHLPRPPHSMTEKHSVPSSLSHTCVQVTRSRARIHPILGLRKVVAVAARGARV